MQTIYTFRREHMKNVEMNIDVNGIPSNSSEGSLNSLVAFNFSMIIERGRKPDTFESQSSKVSLMSEFAFSFSLNSFHCDVKLLLLLTPMTVIVRFGLI